MNKLKHVPILNNKDMDYINYYDNFIDIDVDNNDYYIRKYSDDNLPIYNKQLTIMNTTDTSPHIKIPIYNKLSIKHQRQTKSEMYIIYINNIIKIILFILILIISYFIMISSV
jgi:hypothetical protein